MVAEVVVRINGLQRRYLVSTDPPVRIRLAIYSLEFLSLVVLLPLPLPLTDWSVVSLFSVCRYVTTGRRCLLLLIFKLEDRRTKERNVMSREKKRGK